MLLLAFQEFSCELIFKGNETENGARQFPILQPCQSKDEKEHH